MNIKKHKGAVLIISLIMLIVMTLIGITAMRTSILEEKMAGNLRDRTSAFEAAESALRDGESLLSALVDVSSFNGTGGRLGTADPEPDYFNSAVWVNSISYSGTLPDVATQPQYIIKYIGTSTHSEEEEGDDEHESLSHTHGRVCANNPATSTEPAESTEHTTNNFRITARGTGRTDTSLVLIQSYYNSEEGRTAWIELDR